MRILNFALRFSLLSLLLFIPGSCVEEEVPDPCLGTKWPQPKEYEIKLAVHMSSANPLLPGGTTGSAKPEEFAKMTVSGTIEKFECDETTTGPENLGNTYITKGVDSQAPISVPKSYWVGHVVYVYEFDNDDDYIKINLTVKITMQDDQSYMCTYSEEISSEQIELVPMEMYYHIFIDVYYDLWVKV